MNAVKLTLAIQAVCPIEGLVTSADIHFLPEATVPQRAAALAVFNSYTADEAAAENLTARALAKVISTTLSTPDGKVLRALASVMVDEINIIRNLLPIPLGGRTLAQVKTAIGNKLDGGTVD